MLSQYSDLVLYQLLGILLLCFVLLVLCYTITLHTEIQRLRREVKRWRKTPAATP